MLPGADLLVVNIFKELVLHSVMKDIKMAVKEAVVQWRHNLYRDSIILANSEPNCIFWVKGFPLIGPGSIGAQEEVGRAGEDGKGEGESKDSQKRRTMKQVV